MLYTLMVCGGIAIPLHSIVMIMIVDATPLILHHQRNGYVFKKTGAGCGMRRGRSGEWALHTVFIFFEWDMI